MISLFWLRLEIGWGDWFFVGEWFLTKVPFVNLIINVPKTNYERKKLLATKIIPCIAIIFYTIIANAK